MQVTAEINATSSPCSKLCSLTSKKRRARRQWSLLQNWGTVLSSNICGALGSFSAFESIGGWYGVRASEYFLLPGAQKRWKKQRQKWQHSDVPPPPSPAFWALVALSKIVPSAPDEIRFDRNGGIGSNFDMGLQHTRDAQEHYTELEPFIVQWEEWIAAHREELRKLKPTGDDVNFSPSGCKNRTRVAGAATAR